MPDVTGTYSANDGGRYFVRQFGNVVWWVGFSGDNGNTFTNVFRGILQPNNHINGDWVDTPRGATFSGGQLNLFLEADGSLQNVGATGGFGATHWTPS
jgi:hypothetical protein